MSQHTEPADRAPSVEHTNTTKPATVSSKRRQQRAVERIINQKAVEVDKDLKASIQKAAKDIEVPAAKLTQRFAIVAPLKEQRAAMWWNGLVSDRAEKWKSEYSGPPKGFLPWVAKRIRDEEDTSSFSDEQKAEFAARITEKQEENRESKAAKLTREDVIAEASKDLQKLTDELHCLNTRAGVEFVLFVARGELDDQLQPFYASSNKAATFLQGYMTVPPKDLLTLMDMWSAGNTAGASGSTSARREALRHSVQAKLNASYCEVLKSLGNKISSTKRIQYSRYSHLVDTYKIVLRGYPLTSTGEITNPSDFPGGLKGLAHADEQLALGVWGFEKIDDAIYDDWKASCEAAEGNAEVKPAPPHVPVPGTDFKQGPGSEDPTTSETARKRSGSTKKIVNGSKRQKQANAKASTSSKGKAKSSEFIEDSDKDLVPSAHSNDV